MKVKALLFDMDGVLVDSMPYHISAWELYLRQHGYDATELNRRMHGKHNDELIREVFGPQLSPEEVFRMGAEKEALYRELIAPHLDDQLLPGVRDFLQFHQARPKAVASNAEAANVNFVLDQAGLRSHFLHALNGQQVERGKPDPEIYLKAAALLGFNASECIVFEDSQTGIGAGLAAGMRVIAINSHRAQLTGFTLEAPDFLDTQLHSWLADHTC